MKLMFTDSFNVGGTNVLIERGATAGNGVIPENISVRAVRIEPVLSSSALIITGLHGDSNGAPQPAGDGFALERTDSEDRKYFYVRSALGTVAVNLFVEGT